MELFDKRENLYFKAAIKICNLANKNNGITETEIKNILEKMCIDEKNWDFYNAITNIRNNDFGNIQLLKKSNNKFLSQIDNFTVVLRNLEKSWIKNIIKDDKAKIFLDNNTINKINGYLKDTEDNFIDFENNPVENLDTILFLKNCIENNLMLICDNNTLSGKKYINQEIIPIYLEYSLKTDKFALIGYSEIAERIIKMNVTRLSNLKSKKSELNAEIYLNNIKRKEALVEITNDKNVIDRTFNSLSSYEKIGYFDKEKEIYNLKFKYFEYEEKTILKKILSLGPYIKIVEPESMVNDIKKIIQKQINFNIT